MVQVLTAPAAEAAIATRVHPADRRHVSPQRKTHLDGVFVYLTSGEVMAFPSITDVCLSATFVQLLQDESIIAEYPRSQVYLVTSQLISPPVMF